jgi:hypothetical protein
MKRVLVKVTPVGKGRIKFRVYGKVYCTRNGAALLRSKTVAADDAISRRVLGGDEGVRRFLTRGRVAHKVTTLTALGYDECDRVR